MNPIRLTRLACALALFGVTVTGARADPEKHPTRPEDVEAQPENDPEPIATPPPPAETPAGEPNPTAPTEDLRPVANWLEAQVELHRRGFSCGSIDGVGGAQTVAALAAFQRNAGLDETGQLDKVTKENLLLTAPALTSYTFVVEQLSKITPVPATWLGKSELPALNYGTPLEMAAELFHASPALLKRLNPTTDWDSIWPGVAIQVPAVRPFKPSTHAVKIQVYLAEHVLEAYDETGHLVMHCPVSIARNVEKRPVGELHVTVVIPKPDYTFDPEVFPESPEAKTIGRKLIIQPGPNNPVGLAWIGLDRTGYGIHGTPDPEKIGRTESHGCFRLANWDAVALLDIAWVGMPVIVEP